MGATDIHAHFVPEHLISEAKGGASAMGISIEVHDGRDWIAHLEGYRYPVERIFFDVAARLAAMDALGITRALVSPSPTIFAYGVGASVARDLARRTNDALAEHVRAGGARLRGLATLPMQDPDASVRELEHAVEQLGMIGGTIGPTVAEHPLDDPRFAEVFAAAEALDVPLLLHPAYVGPRPGLHDFYLTNLVGNPLETTIAVSRLILSGLLDRFSRLRFVLVHAGGFIPYQVGRLDRGWEIRPESKGSQYPPSTYLRRFVFDTITHDPAALRFLIERVGVDRVAFGTDLPFDMMDGSIDHQLAGPALEPRQREAIASGTAEAWFRIPSREAESQTTAVHHGG
jgi:aminocarboxymuconate-semialdehyde decarboxylase